MRQNKNKTNSEANLFILVWKYIGIRKKHNINSIYPKRPNVLKKKKKR